MMNKVFYTTLILAVMASCSNQPKETSQTDELIEVVSNNAEADTAVTGIIEFLEPEFNFGTIQEGEVVDHVFKFINTGKAPVILTQVIATCGCTTPSYTQEPVLPGKEGEIKVSFDSDGQLGTQQKIITISSNAENRVTTVQLKGIVEKK